MPEWLLDFVTNAGPTAGILAFMWYLEHTERKQVTEKLLTVMDKQVDLGEAVRAALRKQRDDEDG